MENHPEPMMRLNQDVPSWLVARGVKRPNRSTLYRWRTKGVRGRKLQAWRIGGSWWTTESALLEFIEGEQKPTIIKPTPKQRERAVDKAFERLAELTQ